MKINASLPIVILPSVLLSREKRKIILNCESYLSEIGLKEVIYKDAENERGGHPLFDF